MFILSEHDTFTTIDFDNYLLYARNYNGYQDLMKLTTLRSTKELERNGQVFYLFNNVEKIQVEETNDYDVKEISKDELVVEVKPKEKKKLDLRVKFDSKLQQFGVIIFGLGLLLIVRFLSIKTNIKYYEKHPEQENSQLRLAEEKQNLQIFVFGVHLKVLRKNHIANPVLLFFPRKTHLSS